MNKKGGIPHLANTNNVQKGVCMCVFSPECGTEGGSGDDWGSGGVDMASGTAAPGLLSAAGDVGGGGSCSRKNSSQQQFLGQLSMQPTSTEGIKL